MDLKDKPHLIETAESKYLRASDMPDGFSATVEIASIDCDLFGQDGEEQVEKLVCTFKGKDKALVLNKTNTNQLIAAFGTDTESMLGKRCVLSTKYYPKFSTSGFVLTPIKDADPEDDIPF